MEDARNTRRLSLTDHNARIVLGLAGVDDERLPRLSSEVDLGGEGVALAFAGRVVVMVIEATFPDGNRGPAE